MLRIVPQEAQATVRQETSTARNDNSSAQFGFVMTPHRSLSNRAFNIIVISMLGISLAAQLFFVAVGVWVAAVAALLDGLFLAGAFIACRNDRWRTETLRLSNGRLTSMQKRGNGEVIFSAEISAFGLTLRRKLDREYGCLKLELIQGDRRLEIASELSPCERSGLADALIAEFRKASIGIRIETD
jgi:uncharacterized membrane protein